MADRLLLESGAPDGYLLEDGTGVLLNEVHDFNFVPDLVTLTTASFAPQVNLAIIPDVVALTLTTFAPTVTATDHKVVVPDLVALTLTQQTPSAIIGIVIVPNSDPEALTGFKPFVSTSTYAALVNSDGPGVYWRLGDSTTTAKDERALDDGTLSGTYTQGVASLIAGDSDTATSFDGISGRMSFADKPFFAGLGSTQSVEAWIKRANSGTGYQVFYGKNSGGNLYLQNNQLVWDNGSVEIVRSVGTLTDTTSQHHVVMTRNGIGAGNTKLYLDGVSISVTEPNPNAVNASSGGAGTVGAYPSGPSLFFPGVVDEVAVYNYALSAAQVLAHYVAGYNPQLATPGVVALATSTFAPTVAITDNKIAVPGLVTLTLATFAPTVTATNHQLVTPGVVALSTSTFEPQLKLTVVAGLATLATTGLAPTVLTPVLTVPATVSLALTTFAPDVATTAHVTATPDTASLTLTTFEPTVETPVAVVADVAVLSTSAFAPTVAASDHQLVAPDTGALLTTTYAPNLTAANDKTATPDRVDLVTARFAPTIGLTAHRYIVPDTALLVTTKHAPDVTATAHKVAVPYGWDLHLTAFAPSTVLSDHKVVTPATRAVHLSPKLPSVTVAPFSIVVVPGRATLTITKLPPQASASDHQVVTPAAEALVIHALVPRVDVQPPFEPLSVAGVRWAVW